MSRSSRSMSSSRYSRSPSPYARRSRSRSRRRRSLRRSYSRSPKRRSPLRRSRSRGHYSPLLRSTLPMRRSWSPERRSPMKRGFSRESSPYPIPGGYSPVGGRSPYRGPPPAHPLPVGPPRDQPYYRSQSPPRRYVSPVRQQPPHNRQQMPPHKSQPAIKSKSNIPPKNTVPNKDSKSVAKPSKSPVKQTKPLVKKNKESVNEDRKSNEKVSKKRKKEKKKKKSSRTKSPSKRKKRDNCDSPSPPGVKEHLPANYRDRGPEYGQGRGVGRRDEPADNLNNNYRGQEFIGVQGRPGDFRGRGPDYMGRGPPDMARGPSPLQPYYRAPDYRAPDYRAPDYQVMPPALPVDYNGRNSPGYPGQYPVNFASYPPRDPREDPNYQGGRVIASRGSHASSTSSNTYGTSQWGSSSKAYSLPVEIMRMDRQSIELYKQTLTEGKEAVYTIRVMVVGQFDVGKTVLTRRLLGKPVDIDKRYSTNGIDIRRCKVSLQGGEWTVLEQGSTKTLEAHHSEDNTSNLTLSSDSRSLLLNRQHQ